MKINLRHYYSIIIVVALLAFAPFTGQALGISPALVSIDNMVPQMRTTKDIWFSRADDSQDEQLQVTITGPAAQYITPTQESAIITFPAGQKMWQYPITIHTDNLSAGSYEATLTAEPYIAPTTITEGGSTQVLSGAAVAIHFTVTTTTVENYTVSNVVMPDGVSGSALKLLYHMNNLSNVDTKPTQIDLTAVPVTGEGSYQTSLADQAIPTVAALTEDDVDVAVSWDLPVGKYQITAVFLDQTGQAVFTSAPIPLEIFSADTVNQSVTLLTAQQNAQLLEASKDVIQQDLVFHNDSTVETEVTPMLNIYRSGTYVTTIHGQAITLAPTKDAETSISFRSNRFGKYTVEAYGLFGPKQTNTLQSNFVVYALWPMICVVLGIGALAMLAGVMLYRMIFPQRSANTSIKRSPPPPKKRK